MTNMELDATAVDIANGKEESEERVVMQNDDGPEGVDHSAFATLHAMVSKHHHELRNVDAIKTAFVLPFISLLGYDTSDPDETVVAYSDGGNARADYMLRSYGTAKMAVLLTSKPEDLTSERAMKFMSALTEDGPPVALITDGTLYDIYMVSNGAIASPPLMRIDMSADGFDPSLLRHLMSESFDPRSFSAAVESGRLRESLGEALMSCLVDPPQAFVAALAARMPNDTTPEARILSEALSLLSENVRIGQHPEAVPEPDGSEGGPSSGMTREEASAYDIVVAIAARLVDPSRVVARPAATYVAVLLDDNNRRTIARIRFKAMSVKYLGTIDGENPEERQPLNEIREIYRHEEKILSRIRELDE